MLRLAVLSGLVVCVFSINELDKNFEILPRPTIENIQCRKIVDSLPGCYECYLCNETKIEVKRKQGVAIHDLTLVDNICDSTRICCFSQNELIYRERDSRCGVNHPDGYPSRLRNRLREVLDGEYPWRAWIYSETDPYNPLCAATYINYEAAVFLAPALCVLDVPPELLVVRFAKTGDDFQVQTVTVHPEFDKVTHVNDIALIVLRKKSRPNWSAPACLPRVNLPYASPCVGVSDDDNYINFIVPKQSLCNETDPKLPSSLMCAVAPRRDYEHQYGGGLFCLNDDTKKPTYTIHGIMLHRSGDSISLYTNISHFRSWIEDKIVGYSPTTWLTYI